MRKYRMRTPEEIRAKLDEMMTWPAPTDYFVGMMDGWGCALIWALNEDEPDEPADSREIEIGNHTL
jgi:hypothetical protein